MYGTPDASLLAEGVLSFLAYGDQPQRDGAQHGGTSAASSSCMAEQREYIPQHKLTGILPGKVSRDRKRQEPVLS